MCLAFLESAQLQIETLYSKSLCEILVLRTTIEMGRLKVEPYGFAFTEILPLQGDFLLLLLVLPF